jgi:two-component system, OmpR family, sensor histidine kinase KdpD
VKRAHTLKAACQAPRRKSPDELLREVEVEGVAAVRKGHLKIFLGYASGVGKSFRMLDEARRRRERGQNIVIGAIQPKLSPEVENLLPALEIIPLKTVDGGTAIDVEAIVRRRPAVCVIDGLACDNPAGARHSARWQDVRELLDAGIKVITSINVQYVAELRDQIQEITGKEITDTVPGWFIKSADEIEIVDAPAEEPMTRSPEEEVEARRRQERFARLRELALVIAADVVDFQLNQYLESQGIQQRFGAHERILVCITPRANLAEMLEEARIVAERFHGELIVAYVQQPEISKADQLALDSRLALARAAGAPFEILKGDDPAEALLEYARAHGVTQLFVGHSHRGGLARLRGSPLDKLIWGGHGMDVRVFPQ